MWLDSMVSYQYPAIRKVDVNVSEVEAFRWGLTTNGQAGWVNLAGDWIT
jgi:hypothetical protein